jgi:predicted nucleic-acid-binding Zn-ribbon protein
MAKSKTPQAVPSAVPPSTVGVDVQKSATVATDPLDNTAAPVVLPPISPPPIPRERGEGPICPKCQSGMVANGSHLAPSNYPAFLDRGRLPRQRIVHFKCKGCGYTSK